MTNLVIPKIIAHRGASGHAPENTLSAMVKAAQEGATWVEVDVQLAQCGEPCIIHNNDLSLTTNGKGKVNEKNYSDIAKLDAGAWFDVAFQGERVPRLTDLIICLHKLNLGLNLELKPAPQHEYALAEKVYRLLNQHWPATLPAPLLSSFSLPCLHALRQIDKEIMLGLLLSKWRNDWQKVANGLDVVSIHVQHSALTQARIKQIKASHRFVLAYTVNTCQRAKTLFSWGIDSVFSDYPLRLSKCHYPH